MILLDGKKVAQEQTEILKEKISNLRIKPNFCIIQVGDLFESNKYINHKIKKAHEIGIETNWIKLSNDILEQDLIEVIRSEQKKYDGIIVQLPLPNHINAQNVLDVIDLDKDIDGLSTQNMRNFYSNSKPFFIPATARAILMLLQHYQINLNQKIMVIGESNLVGKPTKHLLSKFTNNIDSCNKETTIKGSHLYDILIVAAGSPHLVSKSDVKENSVIVDVGINTLDNKKIIGDVDFESVKDKVYAISPVPGGVGPLTVICLLKNLTDKF